MSASIKTAFSVSAQDIIDAYNAHGTDMMIVNFTNLKETKFGQYPKINIKLADGSLVQTNVMRLKAPEGLTISGAPKPLAHRKWPQLRAKVSSTNLDGSDNDNALALKYICESFDHYITTEVAEGRIASKAKPGAKDVIVIKSTEVETAMDYMQYNRETKQSEEAEKPSFWINISKKMWWNSNEVKIPQDVEAIEDAYYLNDDGTPDKDRPILKHNFQSEFYNVQQAYFNKKTGKQFFRRLGDKDAETGEIVLDNSNIHKFLTRNSNIIGTIKFDVSIVRSQCKLNLAFGSKMYVNVCEDMTRGDDELNEDILSFANQFAKSTNVDDETKEDDDDDFEEDQIEDDDF